MGVLRRGDESVTRISKTPPEMETLPLTFMTGDGCPDVISTIVREVFSIVRDPSMSTDSLTVTGMSKVMLPFAVHIPFRHWKRGGGRGGA